MKLRFNLYVLVAFVTGFALMAYELSAARLLAPSIGSSTYVWTSVIGVIIAALSLGYYAGGMVADARKRVSDVAWLLLIATGCVVLTIVMQSNTLDAMIETFRDARIQAVIAALILFAPTSFVLGMISPYLAKLNVRSLESSGRAVASLSAYNSIGGITGTFVTGFFLFGWVGVRETLVLTAVILLLTSFIIMPRTLWRRRTIVAGVLVFFMLPTGLPSANAPVQIDSPSAHYTIVNRYYGDRVIRGLQTGPRGIQSAVYLDGSRDLPFWYTQRMAAVTLEHEPQPASVLMLGGGAFTLPEYLASRLPESQIDVVEIDPHLEQIATDYFDYTNPSNVSLHFTDARSYVNQTDTLYDVVLVDVYGDSSIPFPFITAEYGEALARIVKPGGSVVVNVIGGLTTGPCRDVLNAVDAAYRHVFSDAWYTVSPTSRLDRTNLVLLYQADTTTVPTGFTTLPQQQTTAYTDNYAPAERLYYECTNNAT